jgi:hypothetical protein
MRVLFAGLSVFVGLLGGVAALGALGLDDILPSWGLGLIMAGWGLALMSAAIVLFNRPGDRLLSAKPL